MLSRNSECRSGQIEMPFGSFIRIAHRVCTLTTLSRFRASWFPGYTCKAISSIYPLVKTPRRITDSLLNLLRDDRTRHIHHRPVYIRPFIVVAADDGEEAVMDKETFDGEMLRLRAAVRAYQHCEQLFGGFHAISRARFPGQLPDEPYHLTMLKKEIDEIRERVARQ